jgi:23S rRNA (cytosine1962-C5)-methyltransferase
MAEVILKPGREKSLLRRHPWIFSGAIAEIHGSILPGMTVDVLSSSGEFMAQAAYNPNSNIAGRIWSWDLNEKIESRFFEQRIKQAIACRENLKSLINSNARRLIHAESDGIPGLVLDQYADALVVQFLTAGVEYWRKTLIEILIDNLHPNLIYERSDAEIRQLEGLPSAEGEVHGELPDKPIVITENGIKYKIDIVNGHKTGFYLDQRDNRFFSRRIAQGLKVLDCFSYQGGFSLNSIFGGASSVTLVDSSANALQAARNNFGLNDFDLNLAEFIEQDVFKYLRLVRDKGDLYDAIILDPPKFAPTAAQAERASRGYKDINLLALKILRPGGLLLTFSCSGGVTEELFQKIVAGAAMDAKADVVILERLHQAADHPVALNFPEGAYLKGFLLQKRE